MGKNREGVAGRIPAKGGSPAARLGVEELKGSSRTPGYPWFAKRWPEEADQWRSGGCWSSKHGGGVVPVGIGRGGVVG